MRLLQSIRGTGILVAGLVAVVGAWGCTESMLEPLPFQITVAASRTTAAPGDTIIFVATVQGGALLGLDADYGDSTGDQFAAGGARTGKISFRHAYTARGTYTAKISVTDAALGQKDASVEIRVN